MQTDSHSMFGKNRSRIWPAVITNHITITFEINHPIWGSHPANDPHVGVVYEWESADGIMQPPPGAMVGFFTPPSFDPPTPGDCINAFNPTVKYAMNLFSGDVKLRYPRIPIGCPVLMWIARPPRMVKPDLNCNSPFIQPSIVRVFPPMILFSQYIDPLSRYCDCDNGTPELAAWPPCPSDT